MSTSLQGIWTTIVDKLKWLETQTLAASVVLLGNSKRDGMLILPLNRHRHIANITAVQFDQVYVDKLLENVIQSVSYRVLKDQQVVQTFLPDSGVSHLVLLPMVSKRQTIGLLVIGVDDVPSEEMLNLLKKEAQWMGHYVMACQETQVMQKREIQLQLIHRLSRPDVWDMSLSEFCDLAVTSIYDQLSYYKVSIFIPDHISQELVLFALVGAYADKVPTGYRQSFDVGILGWVARHKEMCLIPDARKDKRYYGYDFFNTLSEICFPIILEDQLVGILNVESDVENAFDEGDVIALEALSQQIGDVIQVHQQREAFARLKEEVEERHWFGDLLGQSESMRRVFGLVQSVAKSDLTVLIRGETGTGKELIAQAIHKESDRKDKPFVAVNCAALPESLFECEIFGHERGAFTGADHKRLGKMELADGGTLLLDEVGEIPIAMQAKLLRAIETQTFTRVGGQEEIQVNVRILSATNQPLEKLELRGEFRRDLYFRLNAVQIHLPPLRQRVEDIPLLALHFLKAACVRFDKKIEGIETAILAKLLAHPWPGNVREMENVVARAVLLETGMSLSQIDLLQDVLPVNEQRVLPAGAENMSLKEVCRSSMEEIERAYLQLILTSVGGNVSKAAQSAGITRRTLYNKMEIYGMRRENYVAVS